MKLSKNSSRKKNGLVSNYCVEDKSEGEYDKIVSGPVREIQNIKQRMGWSQLKRRISTKSQIGFL